MISKYEISNAQKEAALDRAHIACIDKIAELEKTAEKYQSCLEQVISDNVALTEKNKRLTSEVHMLELTGDQLMEEMTAANRRNEELKGQPHLKKVYDLEQENNHLRLNLKEAYSVDRAKDKKIEELEKNQMSIHDRMMSNRK